MDNVSEILNIFVPGGPCISGEYWDIYQSISGISGKRIKFLNHEERYSNKSSITFNDIVNDFKNQIFHINKLGEINLIAHSFGAWVVLSALKDKKLYSRISKILLISIPLSVTESDVVLKRIVQLNNPRITSNESFKKFWKNIFNLYVQRELPPSIEDLLTYEVFWEGNEKIQLEPDELEKLIALIKGDTKIKLLWGDMDNITPPSNSLEFEVVREAGHFPMLESTESFTAWLNRSLRATNC